MRVVVQRVRRAAVRVGAETIGEIGAGMLVFLGVGPEDAQADIDWLVDKLVRLRIFEGTDGRMDLALADLPEHQMMVISQFTLLGSLKKGTRPSFHRAAPPALAEALYEAFIAAVAKSRKVRPASGRFGADMQILAENDGPVTLIIDSKARAF